MSFNLNVGVSNESLSWQPGFWPTADGGPYLGRLTISVNVTEDTFKAVRQVFLDASDGEAPLDLAALAAALGG